MSALAKSGFVPWSLSEAVVSDFVRKGAHLFDDPLDPRACGELLSEIRAGRRFDESLFLSEAEVEADPQPAGSEPRPGRNLLERLEGRLGFVERAPQIVEALWTLLGPDYRILAKTVVCETPADSLPTWLQRRLQARPEGGLGAYVRPEFRDIAYRCGGGFRQDLAEHAGRAADFVTLCVYLHPASEAEAPLHLLEGSHRMGASAAPHDLKRTAPDSWRYRNGACGEMYVTDRVLTAPTGFAALWHACTLHGAAAEGAQRERLSLRYLIARGEARSAGLDAVNASLAGPLRLAGDAPD